VNVFPPPFQVLDAKLGGPEFIYPPIRLEVRMKITLVIALVAFIPALAFAQPSTPSQVEGGKPQATSVQQKTSGGNDWRQYCGNPQCTTFTSQKPTGAVSSQSNQGSGTSVPATSGASQKSTTP
jgi:hypothetical protein